MFNAETVGRNISILRKKRGITQMELSNKLGISFQAVSNWERGVAMPDISNLKQLAKVLGTTTDEILGEEKPVHNISATEEEATSLEPVKSEEAVAVQPLHETVEHGSGASAKALLMGMTKRKYASKYAKISEEYSKIESEYRRLQTEGATDDELDDLEDRMDDLEDVLEDIEDQLEEAFENIEEGLEDAFESFEEGLEDALDALGDKLDGLGDFIENIVDGFGDFIDDVFDNKVFEKLGAKLEKLKGSLGRLGERFR